jgi:hypothetical protein
VETGDFVGRPYTCEHNSDVNHIEITLCRRGHVKRNGATLPITVTKILRFESVTSKLMAHYQLTNESQKSLDLRFGIELGFGSYAFPMNESEITNGSGRKIDTANPTEHTEVDDLHLDSRLYQYRTAMTFSKTARLWTHPLWTVSLSEGGFEKVYQGAIIVPQWQVSLAAGVSWQVEIKLSFERVADNKVSCPQCQTSDQVPI